MRRAIFNPPFSFSTHPNWQLFSVCDKLREFSCSVCIFLWRPRMCFAIRFVCCTPRRRRYTLFAFSHSERLPLEFFSLCSRHLALDLSLKFSNAINLHGLSTFVGFTRPALCSASLSVNEAVWPIYTLAVASLSIAYTQNILILNVHVPL